MHALEISSSSLGNSNPQTTQYNNTLLILEKEIQLSAFDKQQKEVNAVQFHPKRRVFSMLSSIVDTER